MSGDMHGPAPDERMRPAGRRNSQGIRIDPETEAEPPVRQAVLSALVYHEPGVLAEISGLFSRRQFNIESLTVGPTVDEDVARMTIVVEESEPGIDQAKKQLEKLVPVISVRELESDAVERELALVKVDGTDPEGVHAITEMYDGETLDAGPRTITIELTGKEARIDDALDAYAQFGIREVMRTGYAALSRGETATAPRDEVAATDGGAGEARPTANHAKRSRPASEGRGPSHDAMRGEDATEDATAAATADDATADARAATDDERTTANDATNDERTATTDDDHRTPEDDATEDAT